MRRFWQPLLPLRSSAWLAGISLLVLAGCSGQNAYVPPPPPEVTAAKPAVKPATIYFNLTGNTQALQSVDLVARVQGFLTSIDYKDGQQVAKGDQLFGIEQASYTAALDQSKATLQSAQATQQQQKQNYDRQAALVARQVNATSSLDDATAALNTATASVASAQAGVQVAELNLSYTKVTAPFDGIVTNHLVSVGALVGVGGPTKLATIFQLDPIDVFFSVSEEQVLQVKRGLGAEHKTFKEMSPVPVEVGLQSEEGYPHKGTIDYAAPQVDSSTGTLPVRAVFDNKDHALLPGLFVRVRIPVNQVDKAILVPDAAIGTGQLGFYLLTVGDDGIVTQKTVKLGQLQEGGLRIIEAGIGPDDWVIVDGIQRAVPGNKVTPKKIELDQLAGAASGAGPASNSK
jgi:RND family efflux transporter MFP subunit